MSRVEAREAPNTNGGLRAPLDLGGPKRGTQHGEKQCASTAAAATTGCPALPGPPELPRRQPKGPATNQLKEKFEGKCLRAVRLKRQRRNQISRHAPPC